MRDELKVTKKDCVHVLSFSVIITHTQKKRRKSIILANQTTRILHMKRISGDDKQFQETVVCKHEKRQQYLENQKKMWKESDSPVFGIFKSPLNVTFNS